jgi:hypothetical protein
LVEKGRPYNHCGYGSVSRKALSKLVTPRK